MNADSWWVRPCFNVRNRKDEFLFLTDSQKSNVENMVILVLCKCASSLRKMDIGLWLVSLLSPGEQRQLWSETCPSTAVEQACQSLAVVALALYLSGWRKASGNVSTMYLTDESICKSNPSLLVGGLTDHLATKWKWTCVRHCKSCSASAGRKRI